jgi:glyoxalase family protein
VLLEGIHHVTCITADAPRNVDFYTRVLGLRLVKKTVNQDDPTVYHLFYADEEGSPGSDITFFEYPGARRGRAGDGMVHTVGWRVASDDALDFWERRLAGEATVVSRADTGLSFEDPEGLRHRLAVSTVPDEPLVAEHPEIPAELALQGFDGVRAFSADPGASRDLLEGGLGFTPVAVPGVTVPDGGMSPALAWEVRGESRGGLYAYDEPPAERGVGGAGTVHHVAWSSTMEDHEGWRERVLAAGLHPTPVIDRFWFRSVYFREPSGVLFEIATLGPGFAVDEDPERLGESLVLPPAFEHLRSRIEPVLTPLPDPRARAGSASADPARATNP